MELNEREIKFIVMAISDMRICQRKRFMSEIEISQLNAKLLEELKKCQSKHD